MEREKERESERGRESESNLFIDVCDLKYKILYKLILKNMICIFLEN